MIKTGKCRKHVPRKKLNNGIQFILKWIYLYMKESFHCRISLLFSSWFWPLYIITKLELVNSCVPYMTGSSFVQVIILYSELLILILVFFFQNFSNCNYSHRWQSWGIISCIQIIRCTFLLLRYVSASEVSKSLNC